MDPAWLSLPDGRRIAVRHRRGGSPTWLFLPGYASDMRGSKAEALDALAEEHGCALLRFDYSGTGTSPGDFADGTLDRWLDEAQAVAALAEGPLILIGSSMGGWLMLHLAERLGPRVAGLIGIAAAPDFTDWGDSQGFTPAFRQSGQALRVLDRIIAYDGPIRLLHGDADEEVPVAVALRTVAALRSTDVRLTLVKGGTHRLSGPRELDLLGRTTLDLAAAVRSAI